MQHLEKKSTVQSSTRPVEVVTRETVTPETVTPKTVIPKTLTPKPAMLNAALGFCLLVLITCSGSDQGTAESEGGDPKAPVATQESQEATPTIETQSDPSDENTSLQPDGSVVNEEGVREDTNTDGVRGH